MGCDMDEIVRIPRRDKAVIRFDTTGSYLAGVSGYDGLFVVETSDWGVFSLDVDVTCLSFNDQGTVLYAGCASQISRWHVGSWQRLDPIALPVPDCPSSVDLSATQRLLVGCSGALLIGEIPTRSLRLLRRWRVDIQEIRWCPTGNIFAARCSDGTVRVVSPDATPVEIQYLRPENRYVEYSAVVFVSAGRLACATDNGAIEVWELSSGRRRYVNAHKEMTTVRDLSVVDQGDHLLSGGWDGQVSVSDLTGTDRVYSLDLKGLSGFSQSGSVHVRSVAASAAIERVAISYTRFRPGGRGFAQDFISIMTWPLNRQSSEKRVARE
jgi:WD40 repeat protein